MLNALRLNDGFELSLFEARTGLPRAALQPQLDECVSKGWLERHGDRVRPTEFGRRFLNDVMGAFL